MLRLIGPRLLLAIVTVSGAPAAPVAAGAGPAARQDRHKDRTPASSAAAQVLAEGFMIAGHSHP